MPVIEFASVIPLPGVSPKEEALVGLANHTITSMTGAGINPVRFLLTNVRDENNGGAERPVISMMAVWPSKEKHAEFLAAGGPGESLAMLTQFITMGEAVFVPLEKDADENQLALMAGKGIVSKVFRVKPEKVEEFESKTAGLVSANQDTVIAAWDIRDEGESFVTSGELTRKALGEQSGAIPGTKNWVFITGDEILARDVEDQTTGLFEKVEVRKWEGMLD
ncbi:hypothetical protein FQN54_003711 [Arachnomyces sp. PD_36]|nr:hypothetical protein FQN54_003711 [Arachnomyces sp. PD_36]